MTMVNPVAVLISDIHFDLNTLEPATQALCSAIGKAEELRVPLIIAGDLHNTKAVIRGEVINRLVDILKNQRCRTFILVGNHDLLNEKGEEHGLEYLKAYAEVIDYPRHVADSNLHLIPYQNSSETFSSMVKNVDKKNIIICHQGVKGAFMGDYVQDKTSIDPIELEGFKVISGHYHKHQTIGPLTYIGSPFTHSFGEANDGPKGFLILNEDGSYSREILNLRKHVVITGTLSESGLFLNDFQTVAPNDIVKVKIEGPRSLLSSFRKEEVTKLINNSNFRLELVPQEFENIEEIRELDAPEVIFDKIIDTLSDSEDHKQFLKGLWRDLI
jgi:DNA repair exonuclease SbcCD nuclease subunit